MTKAEKDLCITIARCTNIGVSSCNKIASVQSNFILKQVPEPWNGNLSKAKIIFISSNPSIDDNEKFPHIGWKDDDICYFFENRFSNGKMLKTGGTSQVKFWNALVKYSNWINDILKGNRKKVYFSKINSTKDLGRYVVCTEIVHCKSKAQYGVFECALECFPLHTQAIITKFVGTGRTGKLIVLIGQIAKSFESQILSIASKKVKVIKVPHPNAWGNDIQKKNSFIAELKRVKLI